MNLNISAYDFLYEKYKSEFVIGKKTFLQIQDWISLKYDFIEVPLHSIPQIHIDIFAKNCESITGEHVISSDNVIAYNLLNIRGNKHSFHEMRHPKQYWFVIEKNSCYMESNCPLFDTEYHINLGIEECNISKYTNELILYLNYFNMRDILKEELKTSL